MKKIFLWLWLLTKRQLKSTLFLLLLVAVPVIAFVVSHTEEFGEAAVNVVALYACDDDEVAQNTVKELTEMKSSYVFVLCDSKEAVQNSVLNEEAVCGYIFNENISKRIKEQKYKDHITVVKSKGDVLADMVNEVVFSAYFKEFTRQVMINYVMGNEKFAHVAEKAVMQIEGAYDIYVDGNGTFKVEFESLDISGKFAKTQVLESETMTFPLRGVMAVLIFMGGLLGVVNWLTDYEKGVFRTLGYDFVNLSRAFYVMIPTMLMGLSTVISLAVSGQDEGIVRESVIMLLYLMIIVIVGVLCTVIVRSSILMVSAMPVILMASILVCPVFIDLSAYVPVFGIFRQVLVPYYYMVFF